MDELVDTIILRWDIRLAKWPSGPTPRARPRPPRGGEEDGLLGRRAARGALAAEPETAGGFHTSFVLGAPPWQATTRRGGIDELGRPRTEGGPSASCALLASPRRPRSGPEPGAELDDRQRPVAGTCGVGGVEGV